MQCQQGTTCHFGTAQLPYAVLPAWLKPAGLLSRCCGLLHVDAASLQVILDAVSLVNLWQYSSVYQLFHGLLNVRLGDGGRVFSLHKGQTPFDCCQT